MFGEDDAPARLAMASATADIFSILRVQPLLGEFSPRNGTSRAPTKQSCARRRSGKTRFSEDPAIVGKTVRIEGENYSVIGAAPRVFEAWDARVNYAVPLAGNRRRKIRKAATPDISQPEGVRGKPSRPLKKSAFCGALSQVVVNRNFVGRFSSTTKACI
jgi:hypothetical protein